MKPTPKDSYGNCLGAMSVYHVETALRHGRDYVTCIPSVEENHCLNNVTGTPHPMKLLIQFKDSNSSPLGQGCFPY